MKNLKENKCYELNNFVHHWDLLFKCSKAYNTDTKSEVNLKRKLFLNSILTEILFKIYQITNSLIEKYEPRKNEILNIHESVKSKNNQTVSYTTTSYGRKR